MLISYDYTGYSMAKDKFCWQASWLANPDNRLIYVEDKCTLDPHCDKFFQDGDNGHYYACSDNSTTFKSQTGSRLYFKGNFVGLNELLYLMLIHKMFFN